MVALFTRRFESSSSGHLICTVLVVSVQPSMAERETLQKNFGELRGKVLIVKVALKLSHHLIFMPVIERSINI